MGQGARSGGGGGWRIRALTRRGYTLGCSVGGRDLSPVASALSLNRTELRPPAGVQEKHYSPSNCSPGEARATLVVCYRGYYLMTYLYESLSPERFQQFCQALLVAQFPNAQCLPVGQPDGGRDAFLAIRTRTEPNGDLYIFQVKFSRTPDRREDDFIEQICKEEMPKVKNLIKKGAKAYYLLTNIKGTAHRGGPALRDRMAVWLRACP